MPKENKLTLKINLPSNFWMVLALVFCTLFILGSLGLLPSKTGRLVKVLTPQEAGDIAINYINENLIEAGSVSLVRVEEFAGMYKVVTSYRGREIPVYLTKDGKYMFLSNPLDTSQRVEKEVKPKTSCEDLPKEDEPLLQAFIVSYCPFGLQMARVLSEIVNNIPQLAPYIKLRYIGSVSGNMITSMHGEKEATENLRQICIREEQGAKFWDYISCFIKKGESERCLDEAKIEKEKLASCMKDPRRGVEYAKEDFELQARFGIRGSPTLILNGVRVSEYDFGGRSAEAVKTIICCGFKKEPDFCSKKLTTEQANRGFSESYSGSSSSSGGQC